MFSEAVPILALVTAQRLVELWHSARNERRLRAQAPTKSREHYPLGWRCMRHARRPWVLAGMTGQLGLVGLYAALQVGALLIIASLGERWTTRILVLPDAPG